MKTNTSDDDCYGYMRLTHVLALCWGLPITRIRTNLNDVHDRDTVVRGHRYAFDRRAVPVWLAYAALDAFIMYYNYLEATSYVGASFKACFEESYCVAVIELTNRNVGPFSTLACLLLHGRRHKAAALAGTERTLAFLRDTDRPGRGGARPSPAAKYCAAGTVAAYAACVWMYTAAVPAAVIAPYCVNALTQTAVYSLVVFQYYVLERGYARVNRLLLEAADAGHGGGAEGGSPRRADLNSPEIRGLHDFPQRGQPRPAAARSLARLADAYDDLGRVVDHLNSAYTTGLMAKWPYSVVRLVMVVFRVIELSAAVRAGNSFARVAAVLIAEHVAEIVLFLLQLSCFCVVGHRLAEQAERISASLQKFKLIHARFHLDLEVKKTFNIFWVRANARKVNVTVGGFIIVNMNFMKAICGIIATYFLVLIQFEYQKGNSKPLHQIWN